PDGVTSIKNQAFRECSSLESIDIPNSVTSIGDQVFDGCKNLTDIKLSNKLESIGGGAFKGCSNLSSIEIPDGVKSIGEGAFWDCSCLESIKIPDSVTSIGEYAFEGCDNAKFYIVKGSYAEEYLKDNNLEYEYYLIPESPTEKKSETPTVSPDNNKTKAPAKVNLKSAKNLKGKKLKAIWKKVNGAKGYEVQYSTNKKFKKAKTKTTKKTSFVIKKLKKKKTYYVRVRAYTIDASGKKVPGKWSKVKKAKISK
ncbi:MAG: leucine-rich repeat domain-containing protein, partial [Eubacterium sp.]|nr:leucine-rich repeat domain-containing protein [Eubacterium sp.]